jgi:hypothetical protein
MQLEYIQANALLVRFVLSLIGIRDQKY